MSGKINYTNRLPQVEAQNVIPIYTEADMGTPSAGIVQLIGGKTYMAMVPDILLSLRYDIINSAILTPIVISSSQKFTNRFVSIGSGDSLFFNSDPTTPSSLEIRDVTFVKGAGADRSFMDYQSDDQLDGLVQILGSDILIFADKSSVFNNVQCVLGEGTRWLESSPIVLIDIQFVISDSLIGGNFPEDTTTPEIIISSSGDPLITSQVGLNNAIIGTKAMEIHSNLTAISLVTINNSGKLPGTDAVAPFFHDATGTVTIVTDGSGGTIECTAAGHNVLDGDTVTHDTDFSDVNYQGDFVASEVVEGVSYKVTAPFTATDTGTWTNFSLTQKDPRVISSLNQKLGLAESMTVAEATTNGNLVVETTSVATAIPVVDITPAAGDWIADASTERFTVDSTTGLITYVGNIDIAVEIRYFLVAADLGGGSQDLEFEIHINATPQPKTKIFINVPLAGGPGAYPGGIFNLSPGDTVQLFVAKPEVDVNDTNVDATILMLAI